MINSHFIAVLRMVQRILGGGGMKEIHKSIKIKKMKKRKEMVAINTI
jgi:hypothetical protein